MNTDTVQRVRDSWTRVHPIADEAGRLFYRNLFAADPSLRPMFRGDIDAQARKLVQMIDAAVSRLDDLPALLPVLRQLGDRHQGYGVQPSHYGTVGAALLLTLEQGLGTEVFTPELRAAWAEVYGALAAAMQPAPVAA